MENVMNEEKIDFKDKTEEFARSLEELDMQEEIRIEVNELFMESIEQIKRVKHEIGNQDMENLLIMCKSQVIETVTGQFGLSGIFLSNQDGGNVTTIHNFKKGIVANDRDYEKYNNYQENQKRKWSEVRENVGYDHGFSEKRKNAFRTHEVILDEYTGRPLPKDGRTHLDHIVSAKEIESNPKTHLFQTPEERARMALSEKNLAFTEGSLNQSKGDLAMKDFLEKSDKQGMTKSEKYGIDKEKATKLDDRARKHIKKTISIAEFKKYSKEVLETGAKDAGKIMIYSAIGVLLRDFVHALILEIKETFEAWGSESFKEIFLRFKNRAILIVDKLKDKWKDILSDSFEAGIIAFFSNLVVFCINLFATTLKRFVSMIRAGFVSLAQAVKIISNPPSDLPKDEVYYQALKIITAGLIGALSLGISDAIEKMLYSVPILQTIMPIPIPFLENESGEQKTIGSALATTLSALCGGILTTMSLYLMDRYRTSRVRDRLTLQFVTHSGVLVKCSVAQSWFALYDAQNVLKSNTIQTFNSLMEANKNIEISSKNVKSKIEKMFEEIREYKKESM